MTERGGLRIEVEGAVVRLHGALDMEAGPAVEAELVALASREPGGIVVDLGELEFIDSTGLQCLLRASEHATENDAEVRFRGVRGQVDEVMKLTGVRDLVRFAD